MRVDVVAAKFRTGTALAALALSVSLCGCVSSVDGSAVRDAEASGQDLPRLDEQDLDHILLSEAELNEALGSTRIEITDEDDQMRDDSGVVSAAECLGALYSAENPVYRTTGYTAVLTRSASEPGYDNEHWVEETAVIVPSAEIAEEFLAESAVAWDECSATTVLVSDGDDRFSWELEPVVEERGVISQVSTLLDPLEWQCQHAMAAVSNTIIEATVCTERIDDRATRLIDEMIANAEER